MIGDSKTDIDTAKGAGAPWWRSISATPTAGGGLRPRPGDFAFRRLWGAVAELGL